MLKEVYTQSICLMNAAVCMYYIEKKTMTEVAETLSISKSTVSRLLKRAKDENIIQLKIDDSTIKCTELEKKIKEKYALKRVLVTPISVENPENVLEIKKLVALEGARYIQRIITDDDIIGLCWGGTMYYLIQYLNPCQKSNSKIVTMHGSIANCNEKLAVKTLVKRAAMAFGGRNISICNNGLYKTSEELEKVKSTESYKKVMYLFENINISISGVGSCYPEITTPLAAPNYLTAKEREELKIEKAYSDIMLRFIDENGKECDTSMKNRTLSIDLETYKKIPRKIIVASGPEKVYSVQALLNGKLLDVLIIDQNLANALVSQYE
ncbi:MAG: sugar-binding domain-containing protein [Eubacterium sp.]